VIIQGYISDYDGEHLRIIAPFSHDYLIERREISECEIRLNDGRTISNQQRKFAHATLRDIADYTGYRMSGTDDLDEIKAVMKYHYIAATGREWFSLSDCSITTANEFLTFLIEFCLEHDIPTCGSLAERSPDIARYIYACLVHKKCCITQKKAQLHHVDQVGLGRDRKDIIHLGMRVLPLHWEKHREAHDMGKKSFEEKYHVFGIKLNDELCKIWKVKGGRI